MRHYTPRFIDFEIIVLGQRLVRRTAAGKLHFQARKYNQRVELWFTSGSTGARSDRLIDFQTRIHGVIDRERCTL